MNTLLLSAEGDLGLEIALIIAIAIVGVLIILVSLVALILRVKIFFSYWVTNREETEAGYTGGEAARSLLDELGYTDVQVKKAGFFSALLYGNHYNPKKKTVYLRASTLNRKNVTSVGLALQKVGIVVQDETGGAVKRRWRLQKFGVFGPLLFIPIVLVGVVLDFVFAGGGEITGFCSLGASVLGLSFFVVSLILTIFTLQVEKRANATALELMASHNFLTESEREKIRKVFKTYILAYFADFLITLLEIIRFILKIALEIVAANSAGKK